MKTEKWVPCTEELAENPHKVKAWIVNGRNARFLAYDKGHDFPIIARFKDSDKRLSATISVVECLIEVPIQERFITFYEGSKIEGGVYSSLERPKMIKGPDCTHIVKLTFDGEKFQTEIVWQKSTSQE